jgi:hypothetical protein
MQLTPFAALLAFASAACFAETWSGPLVDSRCYGAELRNVNPTDTHPYADVDRGYQIRYCSPTHKTKLFAIVSPEGDRLKFDDAGNTKAADLVRNINKKQVLAVTVSGEMAGKAIKVQSISALPAR